MARGSMLICRSCSATRKRCASLQTTTAAEAPSPSRREAVCWSIVRSPVSGRSCLGYSSRDSGQRRVPAPPERITGVSIGTAYAGCISGQRQRLAPANGVVGEAETAHHGRIIEIAAVEDQRCLQDLLEAIDRKSTRLNSSHSSISYAVFCLKKKNNNTTP